jgi:hypothetical protein
MNELVFNITPESDGGYVAIAVGESRDNPEPLD